MKKLISKQAIFFSVLLMFAFILIGCNTTEESTVSENDEKPVIAVSIVPQETFVKAVSQDLVNTVVLIPPGYSPENYAPTPQTLAKLSNASLYFSIGVPAENASILPKIPDINEDLQIIDLAKIVGEVYPHREFAPGSTDPHIWLSPKRVMVMVETIAQELSLIDPQNKTVYEENAREYIEKLTALDEEIKASLTGLSNKTFIVYHPALGYFADDYDLNMIAIEEEGKEATIESIEQIIDLAKKENIKVVFYQAEHDSKQAQIIAEEIGGKTELINPLSPDYLENMQKMAKTFASVLND